MRIKGFGKPCLKLIVVLWCEQERAWLVVDAVLLSLFELLDVCALVLDVGDVFEPDIEACISLHARFALESILICSFASGNSP
jgi:hypothetical protein